MHRVGAACAAARRAAVPSALAHRRRTESGEFRTEALHLQGCLRGDAPDLRRTGLWSIWNRRRPRPRSSAPGSLAPAWGADAVRATDVASLLFGASERHVDGGHRFGARLRSRTGRASWRHQNPGL